jgi:hypothetical protein
MVHIIVRSCCSKINVTILKTWGCGVSYIIDDCTMTAQQQEDRGENDWYKAMSCINSHTHRSKLKQKGNENHTDLCFWFLFYNFAADKILRHNIWDNSIAVDINMFQSEAPYCISILQSVSCMETGNRWYMCNLKNGVCRKVLGECDIFSRSWLDFMLMKFKLFENLQV